MKLVPLTGRRDSASHAIIDLPKGCHTGSSEYASAESEADSNNSIKLHRMSLLPIGSDFIHERLLLVKTEVRSTTGPELPDIKPTGSVQLKYYSEAAMRKYKQDQARMIASRSAISAMVPEKYTPDVVKESVGSR